ncbi:hypothetical protein [Streptomyces niveiscabiei]|uniref:Uncharacterized protein n=1 Tax=Streptomyces niveiscabiei TaxID=164115 RepID=A0ABW9HMB1_9ACTN
MADTGAWDEIVDHSVETRTGDLRVTCLMDNPPELPALTPFGPGTYRVRVHTRGRDTAPDGHVATPVEAYLLVVWPDEPQPDEIHKQTDHHGAQLRAQPSRPAPRQAPGRGVVSSCGGRAAKAGDAETSIVKAVLTLERHH